MLARSQSMLAGDLFRPLFDLAFSWPFEVGPTLEAGPRVDVLEKDDGLELICDAPGVQPADAEVTMNAGVLTITTRRKRGYTSGDLRLSERTEGQSTRSFQLGDGYDPDQVSATLANGILTVHVAKRPEAKPRRIPIYFDANQTNKQLTAEAQSASNG